MESLLTVAPPVALPLRLALHGEFDPPAALPWTLERVLATVLASERGHLSETARALARAIRSEAEDLLDDPSAERMHRLADRLRRFSHEQRLLTPFEDFRLPLAIRGVDRAANWLASTGPEVEHATTLFAGVDALMRLGDPHARNPLLGFRYGSPWGIDAGLSSVSAGALTGILFGVKRVCKLDLEIRVARAELRARLLEAQERVRELEARAARRAVDESTAEESEEADLLEMRLLNVDCFPWMLREGWVTDEE